MLHANFYKKHKRTVAQFLSGRASKSTYILSVSLLLIVAGALYIYSPKLYYWAKPVENVSATHVNQMPTLGTPVHLEIKRLGVSLAVLDGKYNESDQTWSLDYSHAFYMAGSNTPIIYGHRAKPVFQKLDYTRKGEILSVTNKQGEVFLFKNIGSRNVKPSESGVLSDNLPNKLMLMTCSGLWNEERNILTFEYLGGRAGA